MENLNHISELLCLLVAILLWLKHKSSFYLLFVVYLAFISINELIAHYFLQEKNYSIYQLNTVVFVLFNGYIFQKIAHQQKIKKIIRFVTALYIAFWVLYISYFGSSTSIISVTLTIALVLVNAIGLLYLYSYLSGVFIHNIETENGNVWYSSGIIIFCSGLSICFSLLDYFNHNKMNFCGLPLHNFLPKIFSVVLYTCTIIALIQWKQKATKL